MKTYQELSDEQRKKAVEAMLTKTLTWLCEGLMPFADEDIADRINEAIANANKMRTPWFAHEYIMESCGLELRAYAEEDAKRAFYREPGDLVLSLS